MFQKRTRVVDEDLVDYVKTLQCVACGRSPGGQAHHVTTQGAGGGDTADNLMPLCYGCHTKLHKVGYFKMIQQHPGVLFWLQNANRDDVIDRCARKRTT